MNVLVISDLTGGLGGVYTYLQQIQYFVSKDILIHILLDESTQETISEHYVFNSVDFVPLSNKFHSESFIIKSLIKEIHKFSPDVIHIVNGSIKSNLLIREFLGKSNISFVVTEQYVDESIVLDETLLTRIQKVNSSASHVIYVSNKNSEIANDIFKLNAKKYSTIHNGVLRLKKKKKNYSQKPFRFFTVGRCVPQKGIDTIIRAISLIEKSEIEFYLIGDGENKNEYLELAQRLLKPNQHFYIEGWAKHLDYYSLIDNFDLYISASRQEGLSYSLLEAATAGFPIICSDCSGNVELIELCNRGNLFEKDNFRQLSNSISNFIFNPDDLTRKAILNTPLVDEKFEIENLIKLLENIYRQFSP